VKNKNSYNSPSGVVKVWLPDLLTVRGVCYPSRGKQLFLVWFWRFETRGLILHWRQSSQKALNLF